MIVVDNTVLSNFALIQHPEFIQLAFMDEVGTTESVFDELERGVSLGHLPDCQWDWLQRISLTDDEIHQFDKL